MQFKNRQSRRQQLNNASYIALSKLAVAQHSLLKSWQENRRLAYALTVLPLSLALSACNHLPTQPCEPLPPVTRPAPQYPLPSVSYSLQAQERIETWQRKLMNASSTSAPNSTPLKEQP